MAGVPAERLLAVDAWQDGVASVDLSQCGDIYLLYELYRDPEMRQIRAGLLQKMEGGR